MKAIYYIQIEDKNIDEGHNINTLAGLKDNFHNSIKTIVFSNHGEDIKTKYSKSGIKTTIYNNKEFELTDFKDIIATLKQFFLTKQDYLVVLDDNGLGNSIAARLAAELNVVFVPHISKIKQNSNSVTVSKNIGETKAIRVTPLRDNSVITVSFNGILDDSGDAEVELVDWENHHKDVATYVPNKNSANDLAYAKVIVAGGKGLGDAKEFIPLEKLANKLNASVAASKAVTDQGWVSADKMVGISNLTVAPDVYYAFGIAGAVQHTAGMDKSKHVVAVNTDKSAPIFKLADYGIIGDANKVIDGLNKLL